MDKQINAIYEDLVEIFDEEYNKRNLITPRNTAEKLTAKGYRKASEVAKEFRQRMNEKMGKHTHLLGKEYVQRIMREIEKEFSEVDNG